MLTAQIEHAVQDFDTWKKMFDSDPIDRKGLGVQTHRVMRPVNGDSRAILELTFATLEEAGAFEVAIKKLWESPQVAAALTDSPSVRIVETIEEQTYA